MNRIALAPAREFSVFVPQLPARKNRRAAKRYRCTGSNWARLYVVETGTNLEAWAHDLSEHGIALDLPYRLDVGCVVVVRMLCLQRTCVVMRARVTRVTPRCGEWRTGCEFERPLDPTTVDGLL